MKYEMCQSCGLIMGESDVMRGTNADGSYCEMYCDSCFMDGEFTNPNETIDTMADLLKNSFIEDDGLFPYQAHLAIVDLLPTLKRWMKE